MKKPLLKIITLALAGLLSLSTVLVPAPAAFAVDPCDASLPESVKKANGCDGTDSPDALKNVIVEILKVVIGSAGLIAVVFVVIGGVQYITSTGDPGRTRRAKDTILYALIGLVICSLSFVIVNWVIGSALGGESSGGGGSDSDPCASVCETHGTDSEDCMRCRGTY